MILRLPGTHSRSSTTRVDSIPLQAPPRSDPGGGILSTHPVSSQNHLTNPALTQSLAQPAMPVVYLQPPEDQIQSNAQAVYAQSLAACAQLQVPDQNCNPNLEQVDEVRSEGAEDHVVALKSMRTQAAQSLSNLNQVFNSDQIQSNQRITSVPTMGPNSLVNISDSSSPQR